jgi:hypothetical protein
MVVQRSSFRSNTACDRPACAWSRCAADWAWLDRPTVLAILQVLEHLEPDPEHVVG